MAVSRKRKCVEESGIADSKQTTCTSSLKTTQGSASTNKSSDGKDTPKRRKTARNSTPPPTAPGSTKASSQKRKRTMVSKAWVGNANAAVARSAVGKYFRLEGSGHVS